MLHYYNTHTITLSPLGLHSDCALRSLPGTSFKIDTNTYCVFHDKMPGTILVRTYLETHCCQAVCITSPSSSTVVLSSLKKISSPKKSGHFGPNGGSMHSPLCYKWVVGQGTECPVTTWDHFWTTWTTSDHRMSVLPPPPQKRNIIFCTTVLH